MSIAWTITLGVLGLFGGGLAGLRWWAARLRLREFEAAQAMTYPDRDPLLAELEPGRPAIVYFTAEWCGPCELIQTPAVEQVKRDLGHDVQVFKIDADANREAMQRWGVMSLPRTFVLDGTGQVRATNMDAVSAEMLKAQIAATQVPTAEAAPLVNTESDVEIPRAGFGVKLRPNKNNS